MVTYFVVQAFKKGKRGALIADQPKQARNQAHCEVLAERMSRCAHAVVAFSWRGDPSTGDWEDAIILAEYGPVPEEVMEMTG